MYLWRREVQHNLLLKFLATRDINDFTNDKTPYLYSLWHSPGCVRPARPALCCASDFEIGTILIRSAVHSVKWGNTSRASSPVRGLKAFCLTNPLVTCKPEMLDGTTPIDNVTNAIDGERCGRNVCCNNHFPDSSRCWIKNSVLCIGLTRTLEWHVVGQDAHTQGPRSSGHTGIVP